MKEYKEKNIEEIKTNHNEIDLNKLTNNSSNLKIEIVETKTGSAVPAILFDNKKIFLHSKFNPEKEAERFIGQIENFNFDLFVILGFGFAYHVEELLKKIGKNSIILIIEKEACIFYEAIKNRDLSNFLSNNKTIILLDPTEEKIAQFMKGKSSKKVTFINHRGSFQLNSSYYKNITAKMKSYISTKEVNIATLAKFEKLWSSNISKNIISIIKTPGVNIFYDKFNSIPAIVVAAGPSLNKSISFIKQNSSKSIIIAVDTSLKILLKNNIVPHFTISVDPQIINARYFEGLKEIDTILVTDPTVHPSLFRFFKGQKVFTGVAFEIMKWIEKITGEKGEITHGGSVSTNAYDFAKRLGCNKIIMVGQDLAFTEGLAHAKGSYLDEQLHNKTFKFKTIETFNRGQLTALPKIMIRGIKSKLVHTNQKMIIFLNWFEKHKDSKLINATFDGAYINGITHQDTVKIEFPELKENIKLKIKNIFNSEKISQEKKDIDIKKFDQKTNLMLKEIEQIIPELKKAITYSETLFNEISNKTNDQSKINYSLKKLDEIDKKIGSFSNIKDMIGITMQRVIHTINEGYDIDSEFKDFTEDEQVAKKSIYLYNGFLKGANFNKKILSKLNTTLKHKSTLSN